MALTINDLNILKSVLGNTALILTNARKELISMSKLDTTITSTPDISKMETVKNLKQHAQHFDNIKNAMLEVKSQIAIAAKYVQKDLIT